MPSMVHDPLVRDTRKPFARSVDRRARRVDELERTEEVLQMGAYLWS
jgi:hypothetical protein